MEGPTRRSALDFTLIIIPFNRGAKSKINAICIIELVKLYRFIFIVQRLSS